jgi:streptogramin lyase
MLARISWPTAALALTVACAPGERAAPLAASAVDIADVGFATPESVLPDTIADVYLVSNINGQPTDKDDNGFIARLAPTGAVETLKWIDGATDAVTLNAPKGMAIRHDTLFVADIDVVRLFDRATGAPLGDWPVSGATFLNDLAVGPDGTLYVTDTGVGPGEGGLIPNGTDGVYRRDGDRWTAIVSGAGLGNPNGITADSAGVIVVTYGSGEVYRLNPTTGDRTMLPKPAEGALDGVVELGDGTLLVSSWNAHGVYRLGASGDYTVAVSDTVQAPADIGFDPKRHTLLIPDFLGNRVLIRPLR